MTNWFSSVLICPLEGTYLDHLPAVLKYDWTLRNLTLVYVLGFIVAILFVYEHNKWTIIPILGVYIQFCYKRNKNNTHKL